MPAAAVIHAVQTFFKLFGLKGVIQVLCASQGFKFTKDKGGVFEGSNGLTKLIRGVKSVQRCVLCV